MNMKVDIDCTKEECLWQGGKYEFTVTVPKTYPHTAPKAHCNTPVRPNLTLDLSSKHRPRRKCLSQHPQKGLETSARHQRSYSGADLPIHGA